MFTTIGGLNDQKQRSYNVGLKKAVELCQPDAIYWCDGSQEENDRLCEELVQNGTFVRLDPKKRPRKLPCAFQPCRCRTR